MYTTYTKHTIGRYSTFTSRRPRRRYIPQCTYDSFLVNLLQQKEPPVPGTHTRHEIFHDAIVQRLCPLHISLVLPIIIPFLIWTFIDFQLSYKKDYNIYKIICHL